MIFSIVILILTTMMTIGCAVHAINRDRKMWGLTFTVLTVLNCGVIIHLLQ
jgi:hypothetical protein